MVSSEKGGRGGLVRRGSPVDRSRRIQPEMGAQAGFFDEWYLPWTASKMAAEVPMLPDGVRPRPPMRPAQRSERRAWERGRENDGKTSKNKDGSVQFTSALPIQGVDIPKYRCSPKPDAPDKMSP